MSYLSCNVLAVQVVAGSHQKLIVLLGVMFHTKCNQEVADGVPLVECSR